MLSRLEQGAALQKLSKELDALHQSAKEELEEQRRLSLAKLKEEADALQQSEQRELEEESQRALSKLRVRLSREAATVRGSSAETGRGNSPSLVMSRCRGLLASGLGLPCRCCSRVCKRRPQQSSFPQQSALHGEGG